METTADPASSKTPRPRRVSRRRFLRAFGVAGAALGGGAIYATQVEPFWLDCHELDIAIPKLPPAFEGFRIAQLTDLHAGDSVPISFLARAIDRVNQLNPDCVVVTGDLVTHDPAWIDPVTEVLSKLHAPVYVTFGNHDYDPRNAFPGAVTIIADALEKKLSVIGATVLRNRSVPIDRGNERIWLVGMEDLYTDRFLPNLAFWNVPSEQVKICLSHNPDGTKLLASHQPDLILSGHTHGGQVRVPFWGPLILPISDKSLDEGRFVMPFGQLYVSRGVGFLARVRFDCRPEIPVFTLQRG